RKSRFGYDHVVNKRKRFWTIKAVLFEVTGEITGGSESHQWNSVITPQWAETAGCLEGIGALQEMLYNRLIRWSRFEDRDFDD
ncbi:MAG: hypothetical protein LBF94_00975, partial [Puniceicoccales bacterium]|nr:hypothetical protein [Puniceicoccales bacterium]